ncbi:hypothetical protein CKAH01_18068 [Colletotrichum kahawae]|uniref:Azaphilone pigments biosynthesis cluster protein L N-terminal domain-containing protein n=1 Tax=Colletotrichum kahawae TaxID=34407 RepID=A0AAD9Y793_COLKA|nr:hypothetical protein CKAH01_18068 [Colletotrichum kahawae]
MDPFSITVGVVGLIGTSSKIITSLKDVADSAKGIDGRLRVLISHVENFKAMLESTRATLDSSEIQRVFQATGYLASHWTNISACISDGEVLLANFASKLAKIDKSVSFLDSARKALRLKSSWEDVVAFQSQLSSCRETISVSLQVVVL